MKKLAMLCLIPMQIFCCQDHEEKMDATIFWINDTLYIESAGHLYYALDVRHSINCECLE